jgi:hypothetical protein
MRLIFIPLLAALALAACADPRTRCLKAANADLAALDNAIAESELALARGYRVVPGTRVSVGLAACTDNDNGFDICLGGSGPVYERRAEVNPAEEQERLRAMQTRRPAVAEAAARAAAQCPA